MNEISAIKKTILIRPINRNSVFGGICRKYAIKTKEASTNRDLLFLCTAYGIRTRITTVKGWCPSP